MQTQYTNCQQDNQNDQEFQDKIFIKNHQSILQQQKQISKQKQKYLYKQNSQQKQILFNNYSYFAQDEYVPCHLIYTSQQVPLNNLYLGDVSSALDLQFINNSNIKTVVTAGAQMDQVSFKNNKNDIKHIIYGVLDHKNENLIQYFDQFYQLVQKSFHKGSILVHCAAGISRSSTLVISYLMKKNMLTFKQAIKFVRQKRPKVLPNLGFQRQLKQYQKILLKQNQRKLKSKTSQSTKHNHNKYQQYTNNHNHNEKIVSHIKSNGINFGNNFNNIGNNFLNKNLNINNNNLNPNNTNYESLNIRVNNVRPFINKHIINPANKDFQQEQQQQPLPQISMSQYRNNNNNKNTNININVNIRQNFGIFINNNNEQNNNIKYKFKHNMFLNNFYYKNNKKNYHNINHNNAGKEEHENYGQNINIQQNNNNIQQYNKAYNYLGKNNNQVKTKSLLKNIEQNNYNLYKQEHNNNNRINNINNINVNVNLNHFNSRQNNNINQQNNNLNIQQNNQNIQQNNQNIINNNQNIQQNNQNIQQNNKQITQKIRAKFSLNNNQDGQHNNNNIRVGNLLSPTYTNYYKDQTNKNNITDMIPSAISAQNYKASQNNKNFRSSNQYYNQQQQLNYYNQASLSKEKNNNFPIFINKSSKKQLLSGLFDSAIIPIKYSQLPGRAQTDSTNRSPFKKQFKHQQKLLALKKTAININSINSITNNNNNEQYLNNNININNNSLQKQILQRNSINHQQSQDKKRINKKLKTYQNKNLSLKPLDINHINK